MTVRRDISPEKYAQCPKRCMRIKGKTTPQKKGLGQEQHREERRHEEQYGRTLICLIMCFQDKARTLKIDAAMRKGRGTINR